MSGLTGRSTLWDPGGFMQSKVGDPLGLNNKLADKAEKNTPKSWQRIQKEDPFTSWSLDSYSRSQLYGVKPKKKEPQGRAASDLLGGSGTFEGV
jgi:hypothetical protein